MAHATQRPLLRAIALLGVLFGCAQAGVLPDDRVDILRHSYDGGGVTSDGPSVLVRKKFGDHVSVSGNYYTESITGHIDTVSGAAVDAVSGASVYKEQRNQGTLSVDVLHGKSTYTAGYINSSESDFKAKTAYGSISQDMFGDLTTVSFGFTRGWDTIGERGAPTFAAKANRRNWQVGITQILTRNLLLGFNYETAESDGYLQNPYRMYRYVDAGNPNGRGYGVLPQQYPHTRTGNAAAGHLKYYLPWRAALDGSYRYYSDTWGIVAHTLQLGIAQPVFHGWLLEAHARMYRQNHADFYSDLFLNANAQNFLARDQELATFRSLTLGLGAAWEYRPQRFGWLQKASLNLRWDHMRVNYDDYRNVAVIRPVAGTEPLYTLDANIMQFFISAWF